MKFNEIEYRKPFYRVKAGLRDHLKHYSRTTELPLSYSNLTNYKELIPVSTDSGDHTLWYSVLYENSEIDHLNAQLIRIYELLIADGDSIPYLRIGSIDFCSFGNSKPFRIKVINEINDNHDYFYVKHADASRVYGLELEEIFSPDKVSFLVSGETLIEEHIVGIPCDEFLLKNKKVKIDNRLRFAKEFIKFNERCFTRLLGDMRAYNFVVEITLDFDNVQYRLRPMDFDQQSFEGRKSIYLPQYYKDNLDMVDLAMELCSLEVANQYKREERVAMRKRYFASQHRTKSLLRRMKKDTISTMDNIKCLSSELAHHHKNKAFNSLRKMGDILTLHLELCLNVSIFG